MSKLSIGVVTLFLGALDSAAISLRAEEAKPVVAASVEDAKQVIDIIRNLKFLTEEFKFRFDDENVNEVDVCGRIFV